MPEYKLTYFNLRGRAELSRLIFAYAGQKFQDVRLEPEQWPEFKESELKKINKFSEGSFVEMRL